MRVAAKYIPSQVRIGQSYHVSFVFVVFKKPLIFFFIFLLSACMGKKEESFVVPPVTSPLSREYIGFGVITVSYTHVLAEPADGSDSLGYLRRGTLVRILQRQVVRISGRSVSWVLIDDNQQGWLKEDVMDIYDNESQAITAGELMSQ
jgi:hypothetical protein